jgi:hypothetical protein
MLKRSQVRTVLVGRICGRNKQNFMEAHALLSGFCDLQVSGMDGVEGASEEADAPAGFH